MANRIVLIADHAGGELKPATWELLTVARRIQRLTSGDLFFIIMGTRVERASRELTGTTGVDVLALQVPELTTYNGETCKGVLSEVLSEFNPAYVVAVHNTATWDYIPGLAVRMGGSCVTAVVDVVENGGPPGFQRVVGNGRLIAEIEVGAGPVFLTIQPGAFPRAFPEREVPGRVTRRSLSYTAERCRSLRMKRATPRSSALMEARVVIAAGKGMGRKEHLGMARTLAGLFGKAAVAGSRLVCDSGWLEHPCQVGLTGATVTPELYVACGISGAPQHLVGMAGSRFIVAINVDPDASIFQVSDICIVEDATTFLPILIRSIQERRSR